MLCVSHRKYDLGRSPLLTYPTRKRIYDDTRRFFFSSQNRNMLHVIINTLVILARRRAVRSRDCRGCERANVPVLRCDSFLLFFFFSTASLLESTRRYRGSSVSCPLFPFFSLFLSPFLFLSLSLIPFLSVLSLSFPSPHYLSFYVFLPLSLSHLLFFLFHLLFCSLCSLAVELRLVNTYGILHAPRRLQITVDLHSRRGCIASRRMRVYTRRTGK